MAVRLAPHDTCSICLALHTIYVAWLTLPFEVQLVILSVHANSLVIDYKHLCGGSLAT